MTEWGVFGVIAALVSLIAGIGGPLMRLSSTVTKLTVTLERTERDVEEQKELLEKQKEAARTSHQKLWDHNKLQDDALQDHETRIQFLEKEREEKS